MTYQEVVDYIESLPKFTRKHSLEHTRDFFRRLGNPEDSFKVIHVAGTNGKGSVCAYMQAILQQENKKTGFFTSPHLVKINERIQINREMVSDDEFTAVYQIVKDVVDQMQREDIEHPSYFEFLFGMAMVAFRRAEVEYVILETGIGGRLDTTNALEHPDMTVITSISLDHTYLLGETIEEIAAQKAGIIKSGVPIVYDNTSEAASKVICKEITLKGVEEQACPVSKEDCEIQLVSKEKVQYTRKRVKSGESLWTVPFCGSYQVVNAELALCAMEMLLKADEEKVLTWSKAIEGVTWEGRMEQVAEHFTVDGAHNPGAIQVFADTIEQLQEKVGVLIFSAVSDKDYEFMIKTICEKVKADVYLVTEIDDKRKVDVEVLGNLFRKYTAQSVAECPDLGYAIEKAYELRNDKEIYCIGSLYLVGMVKKLVKSFLIV